MKYIYIIFSILVLSGCTRPQSAQHDGKYFFNILQNSQFDSALTTGTTLTLLYHNAKYEIVYYENIGPESGHRNDGIILFRNGMYIHNYISGGTDKCRLNGADIITCDYRGYGDIFENIKISSIINGRIILLGGSLECPYRRKKILCKI